MGNGSIKSGFQFKAYKIDTFNFELAPHLNLLALQEIDPDLWKISIGYDKRHSITQMMSTLEDSTYGFICMKMSKIKLAAIRLQ